jgi:hypothetical protein
MQAFFQSILDGGRCPRVRDTAGTEFEIHAVTDSVAKGTQRLPSGERVSVTHLLDTIDANLCYGVWTLA